MSQEVKGSENITAKSGEVYLGEITTNLSRNLSTGTRSQKRRFYTDRRNVPIHVLDNLIQVTQGFDRFVPVWNRNADNFPNVIDGIYRGESFIYGYAQVIRQLHDVLEDVADLEEKENLIPNKVLIENLKKLNSYDHPVGGTTLLEIEQMPLPLKPHDIKKINKMLRYTIFDERFRKRGIRENVVTRFMVTIAVQKYAQPDRKFTMPESVIPLYRRLGNYLDHWVNLFLNPIEKFEDEMLEFCSELNVNNDLCRFVGTYLPARLGITPSSAIKLYEQRMYQSPMSPEVPIIGFFWKKNFWERSIDILKGISKSAYRDLNLPFDLRKFQHFDENIDKEATNILKDHFSEELESGEYEAIQEAAFSYRNRLNLYREALQSDIKDSRQKQRMLITLADEHCIKDITLTSQNKDTLILILQFKGSDAHLTLEFTKDKRIFGFPHAMLKEKSLPDLVTIDVLHPLLEKAQYLHSSIEPIRTLASDSEEVLKAKPAQKVVQISEYVRVMQPEYSKETKTNKRKVLTPIEAILHEKEADLSSNLQKIEKPGLKYIPVFLNNPEISVEDIDEFIREGVFRVDKHNEGIFIDLKVAVESLIEDPFGPGSSKMHGVWTSIPIGDHQMRKMLQWRFRPDQRVQLQEEMSRQLRVLYVPVKGKLFLLDIVRHGDLGYVSGRGHAV